MRCTRSLIRSVLDKTQSRQPLYRADYSEGSGPPSSNNTRGATSICSIRSVVCSPVERAAPNRGRPFDIRYRPLPRADRSRGASRYVTGSVDSGLRRTDCGNRCTFGADLLAVATPKDAGAFDSACHVRTRHDPDQHSVGEYERPAVGAAVELGHQVGE